jgi:hypothetical protein
MVHAKIVHGGKPLVAPNAQNQYMYSVEFRACQFLNGVYLRIPNPTTIT